MYDYGRRVWIKSLGCLGRIQERNYVGRPRRASYLVRIERDRDIVMNGMVDFLTGSGDLVGADFCCDACGEWRTGPAYAHGPEGMAFCFLCAGPPAQREERKLMEADLRKCPECGR